MSRLSTRCTKYHAGKRETHRNKTDKKRESTAILNELRSLFVLFKYFIFLLANMAVLYYVTGHLERTHLNNN